jgi:hypothetical protein
MQMSGDRPHREFPSAAFLKRLSTVGEFTRNSRETAIILPY